MKQVTLTDEYGPVNFYLMPFVRPAAAGCRTTEEAVASLLPKELDEREKQRFLTA